MLVRLMEILTAGSEQIFLQADFCNVVCFMGELPARDHFHTVSTRVNKIVQHGCEFGAREFVFQWMCQHCNTACITYPGNDLWHGGPEFLDVAGFGIQKFFKCMINGGSCTGVDQVLGKMRPANI